MHKVDGSDAHSLFWMLSTQNSAAVALEYDNMLSDGPGSPVLALAHVLPAVEYVHIEPQHPIQCLACLPQCGADSGDVWCIWCFICNPHEP